MKSGAIIRFVVKGLPQTKGSTRAFIPRGWKRAVITNDNRKNKSWERMVRMVALSSAPKECPWQDPVELNVVFLMKKPKSHPKRKTVLHTKKPDLDKLMRSVTDALTGVVYSDDRQVCSGYRRKEYSDKPGAEIEVINIAKFKREMEGKDEQE